MKRTKISVTSSREEPRPSWGELEEGLSFVQIDYESGPTDAVMVMYNKSYNLQLLSGEGGNCWIGRTTPSQLPTLLKVYEHAKVILK
jgi:hypothetical protein